MSSGFAKIIVYIFHRQDNYSVFYILKAHRNRPKAGLYAGVHIFSDGLLL
ncbi:hypothetical protein l11_21840 [Neisseria weaveri LMG 5135]|nr:hypothetical protein l11_21840 [Neisseria weaveri LMG 5135]